MSEFFAINTDLSRGDLVLYVRNALGQTVDGLKITYSVFDVNSVRISGDRLPAINYYDGNYYVSWRTSNPGSYYIEWYIPGAQSPHRMDFYVNQNGLFVYQNGVISNPALLPPVSSKTFVVGYTTSVDALTLYTKNDYCELVDVLDVRWSISRPDGCFVIRNQLASRLAVGSYFAIWKVAGISGTYRIVWSYIDPSTGIAYSPSMEFNVLCPQPVANVSNSGHNCGCHCKPACYPGLCGMYDSCAGSCSCT